MASRRDKKVADATAKLGRTIARALRSWAKDVGADDMASDVVDRVREGFDVVRERAHAATRKKRTTARRTAKKARRTATKAPTNSMTPEPRHAIRPICQAASALPVR